jgi:dihydrofolate reductase
MSTEDGGYEKLNETHFALYKLAKEKLLRKKRLFLHLVIFVLITFLLIVLNQLLAYGKGLAPLKIPWVVWIILFWATILIIHALKVLYSNRIMGKKQKSQKQMITMIAAAAENDGLGKDNDLVWHLPDDFKRFKQLTSGHHIIMGRKTFESFPRLLPNRTHIIVTRQQDYHPENTIVVHSIQEAIIACKADENPFIIGGGEIYKLGMEYADIIELTRVHTAVEADTFFPAIDERHWKLTEKQLHPKDDKHAFSFTYLTYHKK